MASTLIKLTGTGAFVFFVLWLILQFFMVATDPIMKTVAFVVFIGLAVVAVLDAIRGGLGD